MSTATLPRDALRPRPADGLGRGASLALLVHVALIVAIAFGVRWRTSEPEGVSAELWAAVPQVAAPPAAEPVQAAPPPRPVPRVAPTPPPPVTRPQDAQIAIEKEREKERERKRKEQESLEKAAADKDAADKRQREEAQQRKADEEQLARQREENLKRMMGQVGGVPGGTGAPGSTGNAAREAGPSAGYAGRIKARIKPNIVLTDDVPGNPVAEVEVRCAPDGTIVGRRIVKPSGVKEWDDAVLRAVDRTEVLPRDVDGRVPGTLIIAFRPRE